MHKLFREWHESSASRATPTCSRPSRCRCQGLVGLVKEYPDDEALLEELHGTYAMRRRCRSRSSTRRRSALPEPPPTDRPINPYAVSLDPQKWEADGLFESPGITIEQARAAIVGLDGLWDSSLALPAARLRALAAHPPASLAAHPPASLAAHPPASPGPPPGVAGGPPPGVAGGPPPGVIRPGGPPPGVAGGPPPGVAGGPPPGVAGGPPPGL